jgi:rhamnosyltransferase
VGAGLDSGREVCAILVSYHPDAELPRRATRILEQAGALVIVDNGSGEATHEMLRRIAADSRVSLVLNPRNLGIASALNLGVERARALGFAWVLLLDQDSAPHDDMLTSLIEVRAAYPEPARVAVIGAGFGEEIRPAPWAAWRKSNR